MTPNEFVLEHWKVYEAYMERKERLVEIATTLYLAFLAGLLLRDDQFLGDHALAVFFLWLGTALFVLLFVTWQAHLRREAAVMSESCQSLVATWLVPPSSPPDLTPEERRDRLEIVVYGLMLLWTAVLLLRLVVAWCHVTRAMGVPV